MLVLDFIFRDWVVVTVVGALAVIGFTVLALDDFRIAKSCFLLSATWAEGGVIMWGINTPQSTIVRISMIAICSAIIGVCAIESIRYVDRKREAKFPKPTKTEKMKNKHPQRY